MLYALIAIVAAVAGAGLTAIVAVSRVDRLRSDLDAMNQSRNRWERSYRVKADDLAAAERNLSDLQAKAWVRNERGHLQRVRANG